MSKQLTKTEIKKIISDEVKTKILTLLKSDKKTKEEIQDIVKKTITNLYKFLWFKRNIWAKDI
ncbi:MAG: hypothetical protein ACOC33_00435 [bacterium]